MIDKQMQSSLSMIRLGFAALGGAVAWFVHLVLAYIIAEFGCILRLHAVTWLNITLIAWLLVMTSLVMLGLAVAATVVGYHYRRQMAQYAAGPPDAPALHHYLAHFGLITSGLFSFMILVQAMPILFYLSRC